LYVTKDVTYDNLSLAEFAAGYASILRLPGLSVTERTARIEHFANLMYLATHFPWPSVRSLHAAALFEMGFGGVILSPILRLAYYMARPRFISVGPIKLESVRP
jgi:hypothetical protein